MNSLSSKRALITGGSMGLGKALVDMLLGQGWEIVIIDREPADENASKQSSVSHIQCDLSDADAVENLCSSLMSEKPFDLVIHNAAVSATGKFESIPPHIYHKLMQLNVQTPMQLSSRLAAASQINAGGHLVFISSLSYFTGYPGAAVYGATKDAIAIYAKSIRKPFAKKGIAVSCVFPGPMKTGQADRHSPPGAQAEKRMSPEMAAEQILRGIFKKRKTILPGLNAKLFAALGKTFPSLTDYAMRKIIYEKLDKDVY